MVQKTNWIRVEISEGVPLKPEIEAQQQIREIFSVLASLTRDMDSVKHTLEQVHCVWQNNLKPLTNIVKQMMPRSVVGRAASGAASSSSKHRSEASKLERKISGGWRVLILNRFETRVLILNGSENQRWRLHWHHLLHAPWPWPRSRLLGVEQKPSSTCHPQRWWGQVNGNCKCRYSAPHSYEV